MINYFSFLLFIIVIILLYFNKYINNCDYITTVKEKPIVIDAFLYFQESLMLSIRLYRMNQFVDYFLIVTSNKTHSGLALNITFSPFESFIDKYKNKIIFYNISYPYCRNPLCREIYQRNKISDAVKSLNPSNESIIIISDLDEIPTSDAMKYIISNPPQTIYMLGGYMYYYNYRHKLKANWPGVIVVKASNCKNLQKHRDNRYYLYKTNTIPIYPSQTHCSYCYDQISSIQKKLNSFHHSEFNKPPYTDRDHIMNCIKNHTNFIWREKLKIVNYNKYLLPLPNDDRFNYLKEMYGLV